MADVASCDANIQKAVLEALGEGLQAAVFICDRNDLLVFASASVRQFFSVPPALLESGTRLRDFLGAAHDGGQCLAMDAAAGRSAGREDWLSAQIARHWKERSDSVERCGPDRWVRIVTRRLSSGYGVCLIRDVSEDIRRENQWRVDLERVQLTEEILDSLPFPVSVKDRNLAYAAVNRAMCELAGRSPEEMLGRTDNEIYPPEMAAMMHLSDRRVLDTGMPVILSGSDADDTDNPVAVTHKWRVGKPGRGMLVTAVQNGADMVLQAGADGFATRHEPDHSSGSIPAQRILLATGDVTLEARALKVLSRLGFDSCSVRNERELRAFLEVAANAGVAVDLVVLDSDMDVACLEVAESHGIPALPLDGWQIANELAFSLARKLNMRGRPRAAKVPDDAFGPASHVVAGKPPQPEPPKPGLDVLVAEDNDINRIVFSQILEGLGYSYRIAGTGAETLRLWQDHNPRILFMDTTLPDMTGGETARAIRRQEAAIGGRVPIVGVLARAVDGDREACLADGMDEVILKPISPDMVEGAIRRFFTEGMAGVAL